MYAYICNWVNEFSVTFKLVSSIWDICVVLFKVLCVDYSMKIVPSGKFKNFTSRIAKIQDISTY